MGIDTRWDNNDQTRILVEFETSWTWAELDAALEKADQMIAQVNHDVDILIDLEGSSIPKDFMNAAKRLLGEAAQRENEGYRVVVGASKFMRQAYQTLMGTFGDKLGGREVLFADDLMHARAMLHSIRLDQ